MCFYLWYKTIAFFFFSTDSIAMSLSKKRQSGISVKKEENKNDKGMWLPLKKKTIFNHLQCIAIYMYVWEKWISYKRWKLCFY